MDSILISSCLLGNPVRYDGKIKPLKNHLIEAWKQEGRLIAFCPEVAGGLPVPRPPAEIQGTGGGEAVPAGSARVIDNTGRDVSAQFIAGATMALELCRQHRIRVAILTDLSPSCGSTKIYNGEFAKETIIGVGVTTALLRKNGITVFNQYQIREAMDSISAAINIDIPFN
ncbi:MAG: DUF523 domain-containing protein [Desulfobacteraceae bacterium]|nr:MAG: DUF523 domain-containing protein [Desulfobacteraceae bacterium]